MKSGFKRGARVGGRYTRYADGGKVTDQAQPRRSLRDAVKGDMPAPRKEEEKKTPTPTTGIVRG